MSYVDPDTGYRYIWMPNHPNSKSNGCIAEHRLKMSRELDRPLNESEHVHHKDGDKLNNDIDNLELLSEQEHTHRHKGRKQKKTCITCGDEYKVRPSKYDKSSYCSKECRGIGQRKVERPSKDELEQLINDKPFTKIADEFGVSDNAIRNWADNYGINY